MSGSRPTSVRFTSFPLTSPPPVFVPEVVAVFRSHELEIGTEHLAKGLESDAVLQCLASDLRAIGFDVEASKKQGDRLARPVFFGENGIPTLRYEIDAYAVRYRCGLEVEAGRSTMGNAVFRDLFQAMVMVDVDHLCLAVPNSYRYVTAKRPIASKDYDKTVAVAGALYGHGRVSMPYGLTVIGY